MKHLLLVALAVCGCHGKFKKAAPHIDTVRPQVIVTTGPFVNLGRIHDDDLISSVVNVVQGVKSVPIARRLAEGVDLDEVNDAFAAGLIDTLDGGPPFAAHPEAQTLLEVEVIAWGLNVPQLGAPGDFHYDLRVRIYDQAGQRVYRTGQSCRIGVGDPKAVSQALFTVNNVKQLAQLTDAEITAAFADAAHLCGVELVRRMRKHAG